MARARNIKPAFFKNDVLAECDMMTRLLFVGLWTLADCNGRLEDRPRRIKAEIFPYDSDPEITGALASLFSLGFIDRYQADGQAVIQVINFVKHQNPHKNEKPSDLPIKAETPMDKGPEENSGKKPNESGNGESSTVPIRLNPYSLNPSSLNDERGMMNDDLPESGASTELPSSPEPPTPTFLDRLIDVHNYDPIRTKTTTGNVRQAKQWKADGVTDDVLDTAVEVSRLAIRKKGGHGDPPVTYLASVIESMTNENSTVTVGMQSGESHEERGARIALEMFPDNAGEASLEIVR